ncbi:MAG: RNase adapter RapZ [Alphaproteobacteria bacterium]|nr:MAG: RNase adapter RapZ [Alphaproteobacteria bacterium]
MACTARDGRGIQEKCCRMRIILLTGYSGAGKSSALKACEDCGLASMDNIPIEAVAGVVASLHNTIEAVAICSDVRTPSFDPVHYMQHVTELKKHYQCELVFLASDAAVLQGRYNVTKHRHPLYDGTSIEHSIAREIDLLHSVRMGADYVVDTSHFTPHTLKQHLLHMLGFTPPALMVLIQSFSYRMGVPHNADLVFDVRFLKNPFYRKELTQATGRDAAVGNYIKQDEHFQPFIDRLSDLVHWLIPLYVGEGKSYLTIAIGCTGGKHRSVYVAETLAHLIQQEHIITEVQHRELRN